MSERLTDAVEDVLRAALGAVARAKGRHDAEEKRRAAMNAAERYTLEQRTSSSSGGGGRSSPWRSAAVPYLLSLQTLLPSDSDIVFRALQILHEKRLSLIVGDKPSYATSFSSNAHFPSSTAAAASADAHAGAVEFERRWQEHTVEAAAGTAPEGPWIDPSMHAPAATYFSIESERKSRRPYVCLVPGLVDTGSGCPLDLGVAAMKAAAAAAAAAASPLNSNSNLDSCLVYQKGTSPAQGLCTCSEFQARLATEASPRSEGRALYCKHLLAVRLLQLQCWDGLRLRHVSSSNLGSWLASSLEAAAPTDPRHSVSSEYSSY